MCHTKVRIPKTLRKYTGGNGEVSVHGKTVAEALASLFGTYETIIDRVVDRDGNLKRTLEVRLGGRNIKALAGMDSALSNGDELAIVSLERAISAG